MRVKIVHGLQKLLGEVSADRLAESAKRGNIVEKFTVRYNFAQQVRHLDLLAIMFGPDTAVEL